MLLLELLWPSLLLAEVPEFPLVFELVLEPDFELEEPDFPLDEDLRLLEEVMSGFVGGFEARLLVGTGAVGASASFSELESDRWFSDEIGL